MLLIWSVSTRVFLSYSSADTFFHAYLAKQLVHLFLVDVPRLAFHMNQQVICVTVHRSYPLVESERPIVILRRYALEDLLSVSICFSFFYYLFFLLFLKKMFPFNLLPFPFFIKNVSFFLKKMCFCFSLFCLFFLFPLFYPFFLLLFPFFFLVLFFLCRSLFFVQRMSETLVEKPER